MSTYRLAHGVRASADTEVHDVRTRGAEGLVLVHDVTVSPPAAPAPALLFSGAGEAGVRFNTAPTHDVLASLGVPNNARFEGDNTLATYQGAAIPVLPLTVVSGVNDTFDVAGFDWVIAGGTYTTGDDLAAAVEAAAGTSFLAGHTFADFFEVTVDSAMLYPTSWTVTVEGLDPVSGLTWPIIEGVLQDTNGTEVLRVHPMLTAVPNVAAGDVLPDYVRVSITHENDSSITRTLAAILPDVVPSETARVG